MSKQLPLFKNWSSRSLRLRKASRRLVRRHYTLLPFIGGIIISLTLRTSESMHDRIKELTSSIESAYAFFRVESLQRTLLRDSEMLIDQLGAEHSRIQGRSQEARLADLERELDRDAHQIELISGDLDSVEPIVARIPFEYEYRSVGIGWWMQWRYDNAARLDFRTKQLKAKLHGEKPALDELGEESGKLKKDLEEERQGVQSFSKDVVTEASAVRDRAEKQYSRSQWASYLLYAFGMGLTLTGKAFEWKGEPTKADNDGGLE